MTCSHHGGVLIFLCVHHNNPFPYQDTRHGVLVRTRPHQTEKVPRSAHLHPTYTTHHSPGLTVMKNHAQLCGNKALPQCYVDRQRASTARVGHNPTSVLIYVIAVHGVGHNKNVAHDKTQTGYAHLLTPP